MEKYVIAHGLCLVRAHCRRPGHLCLRRGHKSPGRVQGQPVLQVPGAFPAHRGALRRLAQHICQHRRRGGLRHLRRRRQHSRARRHTLRRGNHRDRRERRLRKLLAFHRAVVLRVGHVLEPGGHRIAGSDPAHLLSGRAHHLRRALLALAAARADSGARPRECAHRGQRPELHDRGSAPRRARPTDGLV